MATRRKEFLVVGVRVGFLLEAAGFAEDCSNLECSDVERDSSLDWERNGFEVKKLRFRGMHAGAVTWNDRYGRGHGPETEVWKSRATLRVILCWGVLMMLYRVCHETRGEEVGDNLRFVKAGLS